MTTTRPQIPVPHFMYARKPPHGEPCTRCGVCCVVMLCEVGRHVFGDRPGPCPALLLDDEKRSHCGLMTEPEDATIRASVSTLIGAGDGCDARFNGEPVNHAFHAKQARLDEIRAEEISAARANLGMENQ